MLGFGSDLSTRDSEIHAGQNSMSDLAERRQIVTMLEVSEEACKTS